MPDPVRLGVVLASTLQQLDALCRCGHPLSSHFTPGSECVAIVDFDDNPIDPRVFCRCSWYREAKCMP